MLSIPARSIPASFKEVPTLVARSNPVRACIRRACPVTVMPAIPVAHRIPVTFYPHKPGAGRYRTNPDNTWRGRGPDGDSNIKIRGNHGAASEQCQSKYFLHVFHLTQYQSTWRTKILISA